MRNTKRVGLALAIVTCVGLMIPTGCADQVLADARPTGQPFGAAIFVQGNPNGKVTAPKGTIGVDRATTLTYQNTTGAKVWTSYPSSSGTVGPGTTNTFAKFTGANAVGDATGITQTA